LKTITTKPVISSGAGKIQASIVKKPNLKTDDITASDLRNSKLKHTDSINSNVYKSHQKSA
jgi:hypothetical protein